MASKFGYAKLGTLGIARMFAELLRQYQNHNSRPAQTDEGQRHN